MNRSQCAHLDDAFNEFCSKGAQACALHRRAWAEELGEGVTEDQASGTEIPHPTLSKGEEQNELGLRVLANADMETGAQDPARVAHEPASSGIHEQGPAPKGEATPKTILQSGTEDAVIDAPARIRDHGFAASGRSPKATGGGGMLFEASLPDATP